ncbi:YncE family protein [Dactylosporangium sp. CA-139066]|uniref:YncE family protein n=1 Tax=Dactylosporangium sp. CA-139066 TaxID=3239930 RepID=UPI003D8FF4C2
MLRRLLPLTALLLLAACAGAPSGRHPDVTVPTPTWAPAPATSPAGTTAPAPASPTGVAVAGDVAVISDRAASVALADVPVPGTPRGVVAAPGGGFRIVAGAAVLDRPAGAAALRSWPLPAEGGAIAVPHEGDWTAVALPDRGDVVILSATGAVQRTIHTGGRPSALAADESRLAVLDFGESSITVFDAASGARQEALRAGDGAVAVVAAGRGRFAVVDGRDGELLVYDTGPLLLRQRYPVKGGAWAAAADPGRGVVWVTLTQRNEVVGFDLGGGAPREIGRHPTVRLPLAVAVEARTGAVVVAGTDAGGAEGLVQRISA